MSLQSSQYFVVVLLTIPRIFLNVAGRRPFSYGSLSYQELDQILQIQYKDFEYALTNK